MGVRFEPERACGFQMRLGLISDTHDNRDRTREALRKLDEAGAELLVHAGDLNTARLVPMLEGWRVWLAQGNVDHPTRIQKAIDEHAVDVTYGVRHEIEAGGARVGVIHGDDTGRLEGMVNAGVFDLVVHGHTHEFRDEHLGDTRVVNPGAVHRASPPSVCVYDAEDDELQRLLIE
jgi:putative phosphoesterase